MFAGFLALGRSKPFKIAQGNSFGKKLVARAGVPGDDANGNFIMSAAFSSAAETESNTFEGFPLRAGVAVNSIMQEGSTLPSVVKENRCGRYVLVHDDDRPAQPKHVDQ